MSNDTWYDKRMKFKPGEILLINFDTISPTVLEIVKSNPQKTELKVKVIIDYYYENEKPWKTGSIIDIGQYIFGKEWGFTRAGRDWLNLPILYKALYE